MSRNNVRNTFSAIELIFLRFDTCLNVRWAEQKKNQNKNPRNSSLVSDSTKSEHHSRWHGLQDKRQQQQQQTNKKKRIKEKHEFYKQLQMQLILEICLYYTFVYSILDIKITFPKNRPKIEYANCISFIYIELVCDVRACVCVEWLFCRRFFLLSEIQRFKRRSLAKMKTGLFFLGDQRDSFAFVCECAFICTRARKMSLWHRIIYLERCTKCCACVAGCIMHFQHMSKICLWMIPVWLFLFFLLKTTISLDEIEEFVFDDFLLHEKLQE